jgi:hypothetical protein
MTVNPTGTLPQTPPFPTHRPNTLPAVFDGRRHPIATLKKTDGFAERVSLKQDICARKFRVIQIDKLADLSPGDMPEDYIFWFNLCAAHGVKIATPDRVFDPNEHSDWIEALDEVGFNFEEKETLCQERDRKRVEGRLTGKNSLIDNPPLPYVYEASLGGLTIDFDKLEIMEKVWRLAERYKITDIAERVGLPLSIIRRSLSVERLLFYQGLWLDPETGELQKGHWPALMSADQAGHILANRQRNAANQ